MIRKQYIYSLLLFLLVSCTSESTAILESLQEAEDWQGVPVRFSVTMSDEEMSLPSTRALFEDQFLGGEPIGIYAEEGTMPVGEAFTSKSSTFKNAIRTYFNNAPYKVGEPWDAVIGQTTYRGYSLEALGESGTFPKTDDGALRFYAYYPYQEGDLVSSNKPQLSASLSADLSADVTDYLYTGPVDARSDVGSVNFTFHHALAQLVISVTANHWSFADDPLVVNSITIRTLISQTGTIDLTTGAFTPTPRTTNRTFTYTDPIEVYFGEVIDMPFAFFPYGAEGTPVIQTIVLNISDGSTTTDYTVYDNSTAGSDRIALRKGRLSRLDITYARPKD